MQIFEGAETGHATANKARRQLTIKMPSKVPEVKQQTVFPEEVYPVPLGGKRYAVVKTFNKEIYVNLREYYSIPASGTRMPAGRTRENWNQLSASMKDIDNAIEERRMKLRQNTSA